MPLRSRRSMGPVSTPSFVDHGPWEHIETVTVTTAAASVSIQNIDPAYKVFRCSLFIEKATSNVMGVQFNGDTGANYDYQRLLGDSTTVGPARATGQTNWQISAAISLDDAGVHVFSFIAAKPLAAQAALGFSEAAVQLATSAVITAGISSGVWNNTADLINRIDVVPASGTLDVNSRAVLEGIRIA